MEPGNEKDKPDFNHTFHNFIGLKMLNPEKCRQIHEASLQVLEQTGVVVENEQTLNIFYDSGCIVDPEKKIVKMPPDIVESAIRSTPDHFLLHGRKPDKDIRLDSKNPINHFSNFPGNINVKDLHTGTVRPSTKNDLIQMTRLCDALENLTFYSRAVYPLDIDPLLMHIHTAEACLKNTSKHSIHGPESAWETKQITRMANAVTGNNDESDLRKPLSFVSSIISPLKMSNDFCEVVTTSAKNGFPTIIASAAMGGGTAPIHLAGLLVQTNAEILSGIVLTQLINKNAPVIYACYSTGMDLKLASSPMGSPEAALMASAASELCQFYKIPCQVPGLATDSKQNGTQTAFEKTLTGLSTAMSGANLILGAGGLETGLTFDPALAVLDTEIIELINFFKKGIFVTSDTLSLEIIHEVAHSGNFIYHPSTFCHMKQTSQTSLFNRHKRKNWEKAGSPESYFKAIDKAKNILKTHKPEKMSKKVENEIDDILEESQSIKKTTDF